MDKFRSNADVTRQHEIYIGLRATLTETERRRFDEAVSLSEGIQFNHNRLRYLYGQGCEQVHRTFSPGAFDYIVSRAVLEEVSDIEKALCSLDTVLRPGGCQIHKIDLRDYGVFSNHGFHPLEFLTVSDFVYDVCIGFGHPNRQRLGAYKTILSQLNYSITSYVTHVTGVANEIVPHQVEPLNYSNECINLLGQVRPHLADRFLEIADEDLLVAGVFLVGRKPNPRI
jgi:hypothetical protein